MLQDEEPEVAEYEEAERDCQEIEKAHTEAEAVEQGKGNHESAKNPYIYIAKTTLYGFKKTMKDLQNTAVVHNDGNLVNGREEV